MWVPQGDDNNQLPIGRNAEKGLRLGPLVHRGRARCDAPRPGGQHDVLGTPSRIERRAGILGDERDGCRCRGHMVREPAEGGQLPQAGALADDHEMPGLAIPAAAGHAACVKDLQQDRFVNRPVGE